MEGPPEGRFPGQLLHPPHDAGAQRRRCHFEVDTGYEGVVVLGKAAVRYGLLRYCWGSLQLQYNRKTHTHTHTHRHAHIFYTHTGRQTYPPLGYYRIN